MLPIFEQNASSARLMRKKRFHCNMLLKIYGILNRELNELETIQALPNNKSRLMVVFWL